MADFVVSDESDAPSKKRKRPTKAPTARKRSHASSPIRKMEYSGIEEEELNLSEDVPSTSTAQQWAYDPSIVDPVKPRVATVPKQSANKVKAHTREPEERYPWLAKITDINRHPPDHPDYDPSSVYVPPMAWAQFSAFEKQYWEIKQKLWNTVVFFKIRSAFVDIRDFSNRSSRGLV